MQKTSIVLLSFLLCVSILFLPAAESRQEKTALTAVQKQAVIKEISELLNRHYIFPETAAKMGSHLQTRLQKGDYDSLNDPSQFAERLSEDMRSISKDLHLGFHHSPETADGIRRLNSQSASEAARAREASITSSRKDNFGFRKVERLQGNIGYLDLRYFASASQGGPTATAALNFLAHSDAIIIDLRQNGGGDPTQIQYMSSYFFAEPTHLNDIYTRETNSTENFWTLPYVPGPKMDKADLYVLTSKHTFSGAEEFSYNMKNLKRATIIGETTGGGAHPTDQRIVQENYVLSVPFARAINPISKTNWEGTGVTPDISIPADQAFDKAYVLALEKLAQKASDPQQKAQLEWMAAAHNARKNPRQVRPETLAKYVGVYEDRKVTLEDGQLHYQRRGPKYRMIAVTENSFLVEGLDDVHFEFVVSDGSATEIVGVYGDGTREPSRRSS